MDTILFLLSKVLWGVLRPNTFALLLAAFGLAMAWRGRRWARWPLAAGLGWYLFVMVTPIAQWLTLPLEDRFPRPASAPAQVAGVIVLGGAVDQALTEARGIPAINGAAERMTEMLALARRYPAARLVFTGGSPSPIPGGPTEADVARQFYEQVGLPEGRIIYESRARNTHENATLSKEIVQPRPGETWLLVTSASHMPRAMGIFRKAGWNVVAWPVNYTSGHTMRLWYDAPFPTRLNQVEWAIREWVGLTAYFVLGRTDRWFPRP